MAGIPTECSRHLAWHNTVAAQRRILTVFPIYFLRLPAASGWLYAQKLLRGTHLSDHICPRVVKSNLRPDGDDGGDAQVVRLCGNEIHHLLVKG